MSGANLLQTLQQMAKQTNAAGDPADWCLGEVIGVNPLTIRVEQKDVVTEEFLELTDAVRDYNVDIEVKHTTENRAGGSGLPEFASHNHDYMGRSSSTVYHGLQFCSGRQAARASLWYREIVTIQILVDSGGDALWHFCLIPA